MTILQKYYARDGLICRQNTAKWACQARRPHAGIIGRGGIPRNRVRDRADRFQQLQSATTCSGKGLFISMSCFAGVRKMSCAPRSVTHEVSTDESRTIRTSSDLLIAKRDRDFCDQIGLVFFFHGGGITRIVDQTCQEVRPVGETDAASVT